MPGRRRSRAPIRTSARGRRPSRFPALCRWAVYIAVPAALWLSINREKLAQLFEYERDFERTRRETEKLEAELAALAVEKRDLAEGGFTTEKVIRERFGMIRPGERVILIDSRNGS